MSKNLFFARTGAMDSCISVNAMNPSEKIMDSSLAGSWYDAAPDRLRHQILHWLETGGGTMKHPDGSPIALIVPHAGYEYSGPTAACAYRTLAGRTYDRIIVIGPSHRVCLRNQIAIPEADGFRTPLGIVRFDTPVLHELANHSFVRADDRIHYDEHSVQIQYPFLQQTLRNPFHAVPVITGQLDSESVRKISRILSRYLTADTLVVISSDFTHFGRSFGYVPFEKDILENLKKLDMAAFDLIRARNADGFARFIRETGATICGEIPIRLLLEMLPSNAEINLRGYANSADGNGDCSHCVSYVSGLVSGNWKTEDMEEESFTLPEKDRILLLRIARESIAYVLKNRKTVPADLFSARAESAAVQKKTGCFVTLKIGEELRGCIGEIEPYRPLYRAVAARAVDSAFHDPRFLPLTAHEFPRVEIEISALTPSRPVHSWKEIRIGRHGITLSKSGRSAVFLPQVPLEQGWNLEETLSWLSKKAGLNPDAWKSPDAEFTVFEAVVFKESDYRGKIPDDLRSSGM